MLPAIDRPLDRLGPAAAVTVAGVALLAAALVPLGWWRAGVVLPLTVAVALGAWHLVARIWPPPDEGGAATPLDGRAAVAAGLIALWSAVLHSEHIVIRRDGGAYALYTQWIATRHGLPVDAGLDAFGGAAAYGVERFTLSSPAFYQVLDGAASGVTVTPGVQAEIVPQFLVGAPAVYSLGWWTGEPLSAPWTGMQVVPALLTGLALLCFGSLVARLVGRRWAVLGVVALGACMPVLLVSRTTYSEPAALLLLLAAAVIAVDAVAGRRRDLAVLAGSLVGLTGLFRVDAVREVALVVIVCAVVAARGNRVAVPLAASSLVTAAGSLAIGWSMSRPYLSAIGPSLRPVLAGTAAVVVVAAVLVPLLRARTRRADGVAAAPGDPPPRRWWFRAGVGVVAVLGVVLASRPLWMTVRQDPDDTGARFVAILQEAQGLPVDGGRTYAEHTLDWVAWYVGWPAVLAAWAVLAVLTGRALLWWSSRAPDPPPWLLPAVVGFGSMVLVLIRPGITPDHPWAARRLVPVLLPVVVAAAVVAVAWAARWLPGRRSWLTARRVVVAAVALLLVPVVWASAPISFRSTESGEVAAVRQVCAQLRPGDVVATVDASADGTAQRSGSEWVQVIRGVCGHPASALLTPAARMPGAAAELADLVAAQGGRLVLLTAQEDGETAQRVLAAAGAPGPDGDAGSPPSRFGTPRRAVRLETTEDRKWLTRRPTGVARMVIDVWLAPATG